MEIKNEKDLIDKYNKLCDKSLAKNHTLKDLTDDELFLLIAGKTFSFGRSLEKSIENASCHLEDRDNAKKCFGRKIEDRLF